MGSKSDTTEGLSLSLCVLVPYARPDGMQDMEQIGKHHKNQIDYILCSQRWRSSIQSTKTRLGADCGSDHDSLLPNSDLN